LNKSKNWGSLEITIRRIIHFISISKPRSIYKILVHLYQITSTTKKNRSTELIRIIEENDYKSFLEVGVWRGDNLIPIAEKFPKLKCYGVDPYSGNSFSDYYKGEPMALVDASYYDHLYREINKKTSKLKNLKIIRAYSNEAAVNFEEESLDVVFIDARHDYQSCKNDILTWLPKVKRGGYYPVMTTLYHSLVS
jgi:tRNA G46 methylase TrmB